MGVTISIIYKHLAKPISTSMVYLRHQQKNIKSKKQIESIIPLAESLDFYLTQEPSNPCTNTLYANMASTSDILKTYSDKIGKLPLQSSRGHNYLFILYDYDSNAIMSVPQKNLHAKSITESWQHCFVRTKDNRYTPDLHIINKECSDILIIYSENIRLTPNVFPLTATNKTRLNVPSKIWKHQLIAGLEICDTDFPLDKWERLMPQCNITINLIRYS